MKVEIKFKCELPENQRGLIPIFLVNDELKQTNLKHIKSLEVEDCEDMNQYDKYQLYTYVGSISCTGSDHLLEARNDDKAPILLRMLPGIEKYINELGGTDHEERYLDTVLLYDRNLYLRAVERRNKQGEVVKVVANGGFSNIKDYIVFGPKEYIDTENPARLSDTDILAYRKWMLSRD